MSVDQTLSQELNQDTLKNIVEAAILAAEAPITVPQLQGLFPEDASPEREEIQQAIDSLIEEWENRGVELRRVGKAWRFQTRQQFAPWLRKLNEGRPPRYSRALLETLAIIAYRQPVTRGDIEDVRGVAVSSEIMRTLQEREWVKQVGVRDVPGHPALYGTTNEFLGYFNLESLRELPALIEQRDLETIAREQNIEIQLVTPEENEETQEDEPQEETAEPVSAESDGEAEESSMENDTGEEGSGESGHEVEDDFDGLSDEDLFREIDAGLSAAEKMIDDSEAHEAAANPAEPEPAADDGETPESKDEIPVDDEQATSQVESEGQSAEQAVAAEAAVEDEENP